MMCLINYVFRVFALSNNYNVLDSYLPRFHSFMIEETLL